MSVHPLSWHIRGGRVELARPCVVGILNVTPDSFSDGGAFVSPALALRRAQSMVKEGADILDLGGESTRPGSDPVSPEEEMRRVLPVLAEAAALGVPISVDTRRAEVARAALLAGASIVNDVSALGDPAMASVVAESGAGLILMHMQGTPRTMQEAPRYEDVVGEVATFLVERRDAALRAGVAPDAVVLDPGIGFGKTLEHTLEILRRLGELAALGSPVMVGASRKSFLGRLTGVEDPQARGPASLAAMLFARAQGASIFRVHDVAAARQAFAVAEALG